MELKLVTALKFLCGYLDSCTKNNEQLAESNSDTVKDTVKLSDSQKKILEEVRNNPSITQNELSEIVGINLRNIISFQIQE